MATLLYGICLVQDRIMVHLHRVTVKVQSGMMTGRRGMTLTTFELITLSRTSDFTRLGYTKLVKLPSSLKKLSIIFVNLTVINNLLQKKYPVFYWKPECHGATGVYCGRYATALPSGGRVVIHAARNMLGHQLLHDKQKLDFILMCILTNYKLHGALCR